MGDILDMSHMGMVEDGVLVYVDAYGDKMMIFNIWRRTYFEVPNR